MGIKTTSEVTCNTFAFTALRAKLRGVGKMRVRVGVLESGAANTMHADGVTTMAELMAIHEFGAPRANIPARAPLRTTFGEAEGFQELTGFLFRIARAILADKLEPVTALSRLGAWAVGKVQARIVMGLPPPLRPATVAAKGSSAPLIDTGQLKASITWELVKT